MSVVKMGFEGLLYYGVAGATGATLLENTRDITLEYDPELGDTTVRGSGSSVPIETQQACCMKHSIEFQMINDTTDAAFAALCEAAAVGAPVALRGKSHSSGKGPDSDYTLKKSRPLPLKGEQVVTFTATPTREEGRPPQLYV